MKINYILGLLLITVAMIGCSGEPGPYDGTWSYNSDKTNEFEDAGFGRGMVDAIGKRNYGNLKIKNNMYTLELGNATPKCKIIDDSSVGNCESSNGYSDKGVTLSLVDGNLHLKNEMSTYVLDKK